MTATFLDYCAEAGADVELVRSSEQSRTALDRRWYASLRAGAPDYGIYDTDEYLAEAWYCWAKYSSRYLKLMAKARWLRDLRPRVVVDLGCGIGWSTAALCRIFPDATVVGTNRLGSRQAAVAQLMVKDQPGNFAVVEDLRDVGAADLVFASEYFEHFAAPVDHLRDVIALLDPAVLLTASTFTQPAAGHFDSYQIDGETLSGPSTARRFNAEVRTLGYRKVPAGFWNDRPYCWARP